MIRKTLFALSRTQLIVQYSAAIAVLIMSTLCSQSSFAEDSAEPLKVKADTNREVALTYAQIYLEQKQYARAEEVLQQTLVMDGRNPQVFNTLGLVQLFEKKYAAACQAFQSASLLFKDLESQVYALYNFADCLHQAGRAEESIRILKDLEQKEKNVSDSAEKVLELIEAGLIRAGDPLPPYQKRARGQFRLSAALAGGFDTNVLLVEEAVASGIAVKDRGSFYLSPALQFGYLGKLLGQTMDSRFVSAYTNYFNTSAASFNSLYNRVDILLGSNKVKWGMFGDIFLLNRSPFQVYNYDVGMLWQNVNQKGNSVWILEAPLRYQRFVLDASSSNSNNDRTGFDLQLKANYRNAWSPRELFSITGTLDNQYALGKNYRFTALSIPASVVTAIPFFEDIGFMNTFSAELGGYYYWQSELGRRDFIVKGGAGLTRPIFESWNLDLNYNFTKNISTVDAAKYTKGVISFLLSHNFI